MYEGEITAAVIVALSGIIGLLIKKSRTTPTNSDKSIEQRATAINDIKHLQAGLKEIKNDIKSLYYGETKTHAEFDKIMGKIHELELSLAGKVNK